MKTRPSIQLLLSLLILPGFFWQIPLDQRQNPIQLSTVQVGLFPEYYRPAMLVVVDIKLSTESPNPRMLTFQIPADSESLSVTQRLTEGEKALVDYEVTEGSKWQDLHFSTDAQALQIEYYDPNLVKEGDRRFYNYQWLSIYDAETLSLTVRQPFGTGEIQADPPLGSGETGPDDAIYSTHKAGSVPAGELFKLSLIYTKEIGNLAYPALEVEPAAPVSDATPGRTPSPLSVIMWLLTVAVAVLLLVSMYYWWFKSNMMEKQDRMVQGVGILNPEKQAVFCHECGMRSRPEDSYCSNCGTELRKTSENI